MASVTVTMPYLSHSTNSINWQSDPVTTRPSIGSALSAEGDELWVTNITIRRSTAPTNRGRIILQLVDVQTESPAESSDLLSDTFEAQGTIEFVASDGESVVITGITDMTEPYQWLPTNAVAVGNFGTHVAGLSARDITVTFNDNASQVFERVAGTYAPVETFEKVNGMYVPVETYERINGSYVRVG